MKVFKWAQTVPKAGDSASEAESTLKVMALGVFGSSMTWCTQLVSLKRLTCEVNVGLDLQPQQSVGRQRMQLNSAVFKIVFTLH